MPLPTGNLTAHFDASDTDHLWQAYQAGTPYHNTQVTADGQVISVWNDEQAADLMLYGNAAARITTPLMNLPCADFDGTDDTLAFYNEAGTVAKTFADILTSSAFTIVVAFYVEAASINDNDPYGNHTIIADADAYFGLHYRIDTGQLILQGYNYDGGVDVVEINIALNTSYVAMFRHESGNLYLSINGGSESSVASGNTQVTTGVMRVGLGNTGFAGFHNGRIGQLACYNAALTGTNLSDAISTLTGRWLAAPAGSILRQIMNYEGA